MPLTHCKDCIYFVFKTDHRDFYGVCHRRPPTAGSGMLPPVTTDDFCGDGEAREPVKAAPNPWIERPLPLGEFTVRARNAFDNSNIFSFADLCARSERDLSRIKNLGVKSIAEIKAILADRGLALAPDA